ncbi:acetyl-CoA carboxylase biotin carboxyl carrier protein, partial [Sphaerisporangium dianthi]
AGPAPRRRITVSTATLAVAVEWAAAPRAAGDPARAPDGPAARCAHPGGPAAAAAPAPDGAADADGAVVVTSPMVGTFYRAHEPGAAPFVEVGDLVEPGQQIGIVEAMKLMNAVQAEHGGRVSEIVAADGAPVQYEEPLLALVPHGGH